MSLSVNEHKVLRSFFTNHCCVADMNSSVVVDHIDDSEEPSRLMRKEIQSALGSLNHKKLISLSRMGTHMFIGWTRKGLRKAESIGSFNDVE